MPLGCGLHPMWHNKKAWTQLASFLNFSDSGCQNSPLWPIGKDRLVPLEAQREKRSFVLASQKQVSTPWGKVGMKMKRVVF